MTFHFDGVLGHNYMSVHLNDRVQLAEPIKSMQGFVNMSTCEISQTYKLKNEQLSSLVWVLEIFLQKKHLSRLFFDSESLDKKTLRCLFTAQSLPKKRVEKKLSRCEEKVSTLNS